MSNFNNLTGSMYKPGVAAGASGGSGNISQLINYMRSTIDVQDKKDLFQGGRISTYSAKLGNSPITFDFKKIEDPNDIVNILKFNKVVPSLPKNYSGVTQNYLYVYLDPFKPATSEYGLVYKLPFVINGVNELRFGYEPFYIGKGVSSTGHRFNQHIANFLSKEIGELENEKKQERFQNIQKKFYAASGMQPKNWNEYKEDWIKIIFEFKDRATLERVEKVLINTIGSVNGIKNGPLLNISSTKK